MPYLVHGNIVERTQEPRFRVVVRVNENNRAQTSDIEWIDDPPLDIYSLNGYLQQALDAWKREQTLTESD